MPAAPAGTVLYAIGDVHGRVDLLRALGGLIRADAEERTALRRVVVCLGDYVDRGADSRAVLDLLINEPWPGFERVHLRGNHEALMLRFLEDIDIGPTWLTYGGRQTLASYGIDAPTAYDAEEGLLRAQGELRDRLPRAHVDFLRSLPVMHREGDYLFVHAGVKPGVPLDEQREEDLLWIRDEFLDCNEPFGAIVIHGHTIAREPDIRRNRIGIDTGAFASGHLTALVAAGTDRTFLQT
ncbi:MAG TPA: metallophosphoesterase family protein [Stellaceae bacterium]|nr:metallophosphoesterase family protein [Stellaceae bacterium]